MDGGGGESMVWLVGWLVRAGRRDVTGSEGGIGRKELGVGWLCDNNEGIGDESEGAQGGVTAGHG